MSKHIAFLSAAALLGTAMPAVAADYYDGGDRPLAFRSRDDVYSDGGRARVEHRQDLGPADRYRGAPGPVVFDERGTDRRFDRPDPGYGEPRYRRPVIIERPAYGYGDDRPAAYVPRPDRSYGGEGAYGPGDGYGPAPLYRPAAVPVGPAFGQGYGEGYGGTDIGCTIEQAQSTTSLGWRKIVTHRTCYRR